MRSQARWVPGFLASLCVIVCAGAPASAQILATQAAAGPHAAAQPIPRPVRFAVIGDYGRDTPEEGDVATLVASWEPDFVITTGDNNYPDGQASTIDTNIGKYYQAFIGNYIGGFGPGSATNRFFPSLGNHDWYTPDAAPYLAYFTLPGNERYYTFEKGPVAFFAVDSDDAEPDGTSAESVQGTWLQGALAASAAPFKLVYFHHAPYSSNNHGSNARMQWPFRAWGADLVLAGHEHSYERVALDGFPYVISGNAGAPLYTFGGPPVAGSALRFDKDWGAVLVEATHQKLVLRSITRLGTVIDTCTLTPAGIDLAEIEFVPAGATWAYLDDGSDPGLAWIASGFDDSAWSMGPAQLGYGDGDEATVVGFGPDPNAKYISTYFRRTFLADPAGLLGLTVELLRDDGAIVYLNGTEILRSNMPHRVVNHLTPASAVVNDPEEDAYFKAGVPMSLLQAGTNVLAVELHQSSSSSSDISFDLRLVGTIPKVVLSPRASNWRYRDNGIDPGPAWITPGYDDSTWAVGPAQLGYGDGDEATLLGYGPDASNKYVTSWFRRSFVATNPARLQALLLRLLCDDGVVVYLNGVEVHRWNMPHAGSTSSTLATYNVAGGDESFFQETTLDLGLLQAGVNVLAVEVNQQNVQSQDLSFDLELVGL